MINQQVLGGKWHEVRGKLQEKWGKLTDDDLRSFNGNVEQLVGKIQRKTGETRAAIERFLSETAEEIGEDAPEAAGAVVRKVAAVGKQAADTAREQIDNLRDTASEGLDTLRETARDGYDAAREMASDQYDSARARAREGYDALRDGYAGAEQMVQQRPGQSVAFAFGLGVLGGLTIALFMRDRSRG